MKSLSGPRITDVIKMVNKWQQDNHQSALFYEDKSPICPVCTLTEESHMHFIWCSDIVLRQANRKAWNKVVKVLQKWRTTSWIAKAINAIIEALLYYKTPVKPSNHSSGIKNRSGLGSTGSHWLD